MAISTREKKTRLHIASYARHACRPCVDSAAINGFAAVYFFQFLTERGTFDHDEAATQMSKQNLAIVFAPNLFHGHGKDELVTTEGREAQQRFVVKMLQLEFAVCFEFAFCPHY